MQQHAMSRHCMVSDPVGPVMNLPCQSSWLGRLEPFLDG